MVSEPLLWSFLSSLVFISMTPFSTSLPPSQQPPQPFTDEPSTSSSRRPWVPNLQPLSLRSFTLPRPLPFALPLQILLRLRFWRYHRDRLAPIYILVKGSTPLKIARTPTRCSKVLFRWFMRLQYCSDHLTVAVIGIVLLQSMSSEKNRPHQTLHAPSRWQKFRWGLSHALTRHRVTYWCHHCHISIHVSPNWRHQIMSSCWRHQITPYCWHHHRELTVDFDFPVDHWLSLGLTFAVQVLLTQFFA